MSFNPKRNTRKGSSASRSKTKYVETNSYSIQDLPSLRRKRTIALNRLFKALEVGNLARSDKSQCDLFLSYCDKLDQYAAEFEHTHLSILELLGAGSEDGSVDDDEIRTRFDNAYFQVMSIRRSLIKSNSTSLDTCEDMSKSSSLTHVKLPKIPLPTFSGQIKQWPEFIDTYNALIHDCNSLKDVEKFHYLISSLSGDPLALLRTFPVTNHYYLDAYAALVSRYENTRELAFTCWRDILNVNFKFHNANEFRRTLDSIDENLSILTKLKLPVAQWDFIMVYHVLSKLDSKIRREFEERSVHTELPNYSELKEFLHSKCEAQLRDNHFTETARVSLPVKDLLKSPAQYSSKRSSTSHVLIADNTTVPMTNQTSKPTSKCSYCTDVHSITQCKEFLAKSVDERMSVATEKRWCFNCLKSSHHLKDCSSIFRCLKCKHKHHTLLHQDQAVNKPNIDTNSTGSQAVSLLAKGSNTTFGSKSLTNTTVLLATAIVQVQDANGQYHSFRALFDSGSQNNFITHAAAQRLNLNLVPSKTNIHGLGGVATDIFGEVHCFIASNKKRLFEVDMQVISHICGDQPISKLNTMGWSHIQSLPLADPGFDIPGKIDILLSAEVFAESLLNERIKGNANQPLAINSVFGWLLLGRTPLVTSTLLQVLSKSDELASMVQRFWEVDDVPKASSLTPEETFCEQAFASEHYRDSSGRYVVRLPFRDGAEPIFEGSREMALRRFKAIERRLSRDPELHKQYSDFMDEYHKSGHMTLVGTKELNLGRYYIPHHCILRPDSATTKLRVVFDASAKDANNKSLNNTLLTGPKLQSNIMGILLNFRIYAIVFMADIRQMYRQILVADDQRDYQRIFWRSNPNQALQEYRLNTVTYGVSSAPFLACRTIKQLAEDEGHQFPLAKRILTTNTYVDDVVSGSDLLEDAQKAKAQIIELFKLGHFKLRKWASNEPRLLSDLPKEECLSDHIPFSDGEPFTMKVLGLKWDPASDSFLFDVKPSNRSCTKRIILSEIARIFDPLGFLSPLIIQAKCLLQKLWINGISWDADPPEEIINVWKSFCDQLPILQELRIPRRVSTPNAKSYELHGFCDSSELAYGAIIYLRTMCYDGSVRIVPLCAKARVAPIKKVSLPRLELCAAVLLADLVKFVCDTYQSMLPTLKLPVWSDSTVVLSWLRSHSSRWTTFVANRVSYIQDIIPAESWHHTLSVHNPADVCSRGQLPQDLLYNSLWWLGPPWLLKTPDQWPCLKSLPKPTNAEDNIVRNEERSSMVLVTESSDELVTPIDYLLNRCSSLAKITRIVSYMRRFIHNSRNRHEQRLDPILTEAENYQSLLVIVRFVQSTSFINEIKQLQSKQALPKPLRKLNPFLDEEGTLRVGGRISRSGLEFEQKHPALLPGNHPFTFKLIESIHRQHCHTGHNTTQYLILQRFWVLCAKRAIRHCLSQCIRCYRTHPKPLEPYMGDLPSFRVNQVKPFSVVGVDIGGPFRIKIGAYRGAKIDKSYLCLFVCLATKAVHLEIVSSLSTEGFIAALRRFVGRRGRCSVIHADCGTNFVGTSNYFSLLEQAAQTHHIKFDFNPPSAPHFGGVFEIQIKAAKSHLYRTVGHQVLTFEELTTFFVQIEAVLNSRPLYPMSSDPNDLNVLTPGHFLTLEPLTTVPDEDYSHTKLHRLNRWQLIQSFLQNFWIRWKNEYLNSLTQRAKWTKASKPLSLNSIVIIKDDNRAPLQWSLGRVTELHPGLDGIVRVATIKTKHNFIKRPLVKLCPLPIES